MTSIQGHTPAAGVASRNRANPVRRATLALLVAVSVAAACNSSDLLDVETPANVPVGLLDDPTNAGLMVNSAVGDFECALGATIAVQGIISDELADAQLGAAAWPYDRRDANTQTNGSYGTVGCAGNQTPGIYNPLSTARWAADHAVTNLGAWTDAQVSGRQALLAKASLYAGFSYSLIGMSMCSAAFDLGPEVQQAAIFPLAEARFTAAIAAAQGAQSAALLNAAYAGRARVRLFQGNKAGAATDAALVPAGFVFAAANDATDNRIYNRIFTITAQFGFYTVEGSSRDLRTERGEVDPRSASTATNTRPADARSTIWVPNKYASGYAAPTRIVSYDEARLILAEAQGGQSAVTIINALRSAAGLLPYTGATDAASIQSLIIDERRRVLFLEGFRNYDMQRFNVPFSPAVGEPYPIKGGTYGNTRCLPLPDVERFNNPSIG
ncbi:MAG: RagB/SusD family nutrient uptake outer membrane protein [Gemmatimonadetes bacterium]|nr:RagB/SusD family nutrient uptake outer membrane protein [Gemmatimonadota bacterium]MCC6773328.1 RagB/SusD family nutrient uptake outer membrane protein [Gemmatimonadaceae bacterium]